MSAALRSSEVAHRRWSIARAAPAIAWAAAFGRTSLPAEVRRLLIDLGPAYAKIGQVLSTRVDALPEPLVRELASLRDAMPALPGSTVAEVLDRAFPDGLQTVFDELDPAPLAAGTVAQVHRGVLRSGELVAVKVLRPGIRSDIERNFRALLSVAGAAQVVSRQARVVDARGLVLELRDLLLAQTDLTTEARNYRLLDRHFRGSTTVRIPRLFAELSSRDVLVTELVAGIDPYDVERVALDRLTLARRVDDLTDDMIFVHGLCHADLHPGNFFWTEEGQIVLVDLGLVHQLTKEERQHVLAFYASVLDGFHGFAAEYFLRHFVRSADGHGEPTRAIAEVGDLVRKHWADSDGRPSFSAMFPDIMRVLVRHRLRLTHDYSKLFLTLVTMEGYLYSLEPTFDMLENARRKRVERAEYAAVPDTAHELVFGPAASYSAGRWTSADSPEQAYRRRNELVLDALQVGAESTFLDVGCGRGELLQAARDRGARTVGITVSRTEQEACRRRGVRTLLAGWEDVDRLHPQWCDRAAAIAVVEMDNHLATLHENKVGLLDLRLDRFFAWARRHVTDDGRLFMQCLAVPQELLGDPSWSSDYDRLTEVAPWLGFSTLPQIVRCSARTFLVEHVTDHSADLQPTYEFWRTNVNRSLPALRAIVGDDVLVYLRRQLDMLIWLTERERLQLYRLLLRPR